MLDESRFKFVKTADIVWSHRGHPPHEKGTHVSVSIFCVELTPEEKEIAGNGLNDEHYKDFGIKGFTRDDLIKNNAFEALIDTYDRIFPLKR